MLDGCASYSLQTWAGVGRIWPKAQKSCACTPIGDISLYASIVDSNLHESIDRSSCKPDAHVVWPALLDALHVHGRMGPIMNACTTLYGSCLLTYANLSYVYAYVPRLVVVSHLDSWFIHIFMTSVHNK